MTMLVLQGGSAGSANFTLFAFSTHLFCGKSIFFAVTRFLDLCGDGDHSDGGDGDDGVGDDGDSTIGS